MKHFLPALLLLCCGCAIAQDTANFPGRFPREQAGPARTLVASGIMAGIIGTSFVWAFDSWWEGRAHHWNFYNEGWFKDYSLGIDKVGHAYASYFYFQSFHNVMLWGGFDESDALWWGAGISEFLALCLEVGDGFSAYGFSYEDFVANTIGVTFGVLRVRTPFLQNFSFKWSYIPVRMRRGLDFTEHYDAHTYWLAVNLHELLPPCWQPYWPSFLQPAMGYGVDALQTRREAVIGLDFNLEVFPPSNPDLLLVQKTLNMIHIPAPAVKFTGGKEPRYYLFHLN